MDQVAVVIVTHNSQSALPRAIESLDAQSIRAQRIIIVDSGSDHCGYLARYAKREDICLLQEENLGFCQANNLGFAHVPDNCSYVLFQNPDCFLTPTWIEKSLKKINESSHTQVGMLSGLLLGWDLAQQEPSGLIDSAGIFRTWYGRWYDRNQGKPVDTAMHSAKFVPALCAALLFCRKQALFEASLGPGQVWDSRLFMYKDDIELSIRVKKAGWQLLFSPCLTAYHCRGWKKERSKMPRRARLLSARNELRINLVNYPPGAFYSAAKYAAVALLDW